MILKIKTNKENEFIDITDKINNLIDIEEGICIIYCPHTTAGLTINEGADPSVKKDIISTLNKLIPDDPSYEHLEGNSAAHVKSSLVGNSLNIIIEKGKLKLGVWESIFFCEFDGPRNREIYIKILTTK